MLFDVDGTLVDTTYLHVTCWWQALRQFGIDVPMARVHRAIGTGSDRLLDVVLGTDRDHSDDDAMIAAHAAHYSAYWQRLRPLPAAAELLRACAGRGLRVVLASSASARELAALRAALGADDVIDTATSSADAAASKPAPDILQAALDQSGLAASRVVFVGDAVWDVEAAGKLGIPCVGLTCGGLSAAELRDAGAVETYDDPAALLAALDTSVVSSVH